MYEMKNMLLKLISRYLIHIQKKKTAFQKDKTLFEFAMVFDKI